MQIIAAQCHEDADIEEVAEDDVSGAFLDPRMVKKTRADEIEYAITMKVYTKAPRTERLKIIGKQKVD